jgi:hypothetical protein
MKQGRALWEREVKTEAELAMLQGIIIRGGWA